MGSLLSNPFSKPTTVSGHSNGDETENNKITTGTSTASTWTETLITSSTNVESETSLSSNTSTYTQTDPQTTLVVDRSQSTSESLQSSTSTLQTTEPYTAYTSVSTSEYISSQGIATDLTTQSPSVTKPSSVDIGLIIGPAVGGAVLIIIIVIILALVLVRRHLAARKLRETKSKSSETSTYMNGTEIASLYPNRINMTSEYVNTTEMTSSSFESTEGDTTGSSSFMDEQTMTYADLAKPHIYQNAPRRVPQPTVVSDTVYSEVIRAN